MSLLTNAQLVSIQAMGQQGMTDTVQIYAVTIDEDSDAYGSKHSWSATATATTVGWLVGLWSSNRTQGAGDLDTTTTFHLRLPVGTNVKTGDKAVVRGGTYVIVDVGDDQTWPEWLLAVCLRST